MKVRDLKLSALEAQFKFEGMNFAGKYRPAVSLSERGEYSIRVLKRKAIDWNGNQHLAWEYFTLDLDGLIIASPRGFAKNYNKKVRIIDIKERLPEFAEQK